jgi:peptidoglycan hydrolase-like protein with peptidoglycan-binding domain
MRKSRASLLGTAFQLFLISAILADDQVRDVQIELRKRHLFHGDSTGEITPALTAAVRRYQEIKGFRRTGIIDWETSASLGLSGYVVPVATPFVLDNHGEARGPNGEPLPESTSGSWLSDERAVQFAHSIAKPNLSPDALRRESHNTPKSQSPAKRQSAGRAHTIRAHKETNPFRQALSSIDRARKFLFGDSDAKKKHRIAKRL